MTAAQKLLVIGLDGGAFDLLQPLIDRGHMPHLARLQQRGAWGPLASTVPPFTAAAWSSFITGYNPGRHGVLSFTRRDRFNYDMQGKGFVNAQRFPLTLWERLGQGDKQVGVVNVPLTYPPRPVNGFMVTGMLTPPNAAQFTFPAAFASRLGPEYVVDLDFIRDEDGFRLHGLPSKEEMLPQIQQMTAARIDTCVRLLGEEPWHFFMVVFTGTDRISHFFWDDLEGIIDDAQPGNAQPLSPLQQQLLHYFHTLDEGIGQLLQKAGDEALVMMLSDHGFGPAPTRRFYVNVWLEQLGLLQPRAADGALDLDYWRMRLGRHKQLKALLRRVLPQSTQDSVSRSTQAASGGKESVDWSRTQAYFVPIYFHVCGVEVNRQGQRREGIVPPGAPYEAIRQQIIDAARELRDPQDGRPFVTLAARREELFQGPYVQEFPDVILVLDPDVIGARSLAGSSLLEPHPDPMRPGEHREDGIFLAAGPQIAQLAEPLPHLRLVDTPATILYALGLPVPTDFDGRSLLEIFTPAFRQQNPLRYEEASAPLVQGHDSAFSDAESEGLEERLRGLGYLE